MAIITTNASGDDYFDVFQTSFVPANPTIVANAAEFSYTVPGSSPGLSKPSYAIHTMLAGSGFSYGADPDDGPVGGSIRAFYSYTTSTGPRQPPPPLPPKTWEDVYIETSPFAIDTRNAPISLPAGFQFDSTDLFWRTMLSGEDTIDLKLRTVPVFAGDGRDIAVGAPAVGAKDVFTISYAAASIVPDDGLPTPSLQAPEVYGDFRVVLIRATAYGGDDTINCVTAAGDGSFITPGQVSGDVRDVGQSLDSSKGGTLFGGNDTIDLGGAATGRMSLATFSTCGAQAKSPAATIGSSAPPSATSSMATPAASPAALPSQAATIRCSGWTATTRSMATIPDCPRP